MCNAGRAVAAVTAATVEECVSSNPSGARLADGGSSPSPTTEEKCKQSPTLVYVTQVSLGAEGRRQWGHRGERGEDKWR